MANAECRWMGGLTAACRSTTFPSFHRRAVAALPSEMGMSTAPTAWPDAATAWSALPSRPPAGSPKLGHARAAICSFRSIVSPAVHIAAWLVPEDEPHDLPLGAHRPGIQRV